MTKLGQFSECSQPSSTAFPDDINQWPEPYRRAAFAARDRLLSENPGRRVVEEISYCIGRDHPRFSDNTQDRFSHFLVFQVYLDGEVDPSYRWDEVSHDWEPAE
jgi:hypothetical protein